MADVTIRSVATAAQVSIATVSRAMNGKPTVAPELSARVLEAADRLGYRPSATARRLVTGRTGLVGVVVPDLSNPFFHGVLKGLTSASADDDYGIVVADAEESPERELLLARGLLAQTDALVLCSPRMRADQLQEIATDPRPTICVNRAQAGVAMPCVTIDEHEAALSLAGHLITAGHRRVVYLRGPEQSWSDRERWRAMQDAAAFGLLAEAQPCGSDMDAGFNAAPAVLDRDVTAVVAFNDYVAFGVLSGLQALGCRVPNDISLAGFDDIPFAAYASPALTTVRRPVVPLGQEAWRALSARLRGVAAPEPVALRGQLIPRSSVGSPATSSATHRSARETH